MRSKKAEVAEKAAHWDSIAGEYADEYVAILVVGHGKDANTLARRIHREYPDKPVAIFPPLDAPVLHLPSVFRVPSSRTLVRRQRM